MNTTDSKNVAALRRVRQETVDAAEPMFVSYEQAKQIDSIPAQWGDPLRTLERKIRRLAEMLNCTEEEATQVFLHRL
jgi:hypothetical protein